MVILSYAAALVFLGGLMLQLWRYVSAIKPYDISLPPHGYTLVEVQRRRVVNAVFLQRLLYADTCLWVCSIFLHWSLLLLVLKHGKYAWVDVPEWMYVFDEVGSYGAVALGVSAIALLVRRIWSAPLRFVSRMEDYCIVVLFACMAVSGLALKYWWPVSFLEVRGFVYGLVTLAPREFPEHMLFRVHFCLFLILLAVFPFTKLIHAVSVFFLPVLNRRVKR